MQIGTNPFLQSGGGLPLFKPSKPEEPANTPEESKATQDSGGDESIASKDIDTLREQLRKSSEPTEADKLRSKIAANVLEKFQQLQQKLNPQNKNNNNALMALNPIKTPQPSKPEASKEKEEDKKPEDSQKPPLQGNSGSGNGLTIKDFNLIPMTSFQTSTTASYHATHDKETGQTTQEMMYSNTYNFTFLGSVVDKHGNKHNIEANVTLTHSVYTKITGGTDTLDPKVLEELQKGTPFNFDYEGDGSDLKDQNFGFLFDDKGAKDQISAHDSVFGDLIDKAFGEGLGSLLEGLRVFAIGENTPTQGENTPAQGENTPTLNNPLNAFKPNSNNPFENLIGLGEKGIGMIFLTQFQSQILYQSSKDGYSLNASFSFSSTSVSFFGEKDKNTLESILERQKLLKEKEGNDPADIKKALNHYKNADA